MKLPIYKTYSSPIALFTIACFLQAILGCGRAPASGSVFIRVSDSRGQINEKEFSREEFATSAKASVDALLAPDQEAIDPAQILREGTVSLKLSNGKTLVLKTEGDRVVLVNGSNAASLSWNADRTQLTVTTPSGTSQVDLAGANDPEAVARFVGNTAIGLFAVLEDPNLGASMAAGERAYCGPCVVFIVLVIAWIVCITGGTWICTQQAYNICDYGVKDVWMNCGVTYHNGWQLGFGCNIECWGPW